MCRRYGTAPVPDPTQHVPPDHRAADLLFNIVSRRHEEKSTVITTNLPYKQWGTIFPEATCLSPLIDRFAEHCHVVDIDADSYRLNGPEAKKAKTKRRSRRSTR
ncbi:MAG: ATP-binding protein [Myxococcota bacterium]